MISIEDVSKVYTVSRQLRYPALQHLSAQIDDGELLAVVGPSGAGKSTLLHILAGIDTPTAGKVWFDGENICKFGDRRLARFRNRTVSIVLQDFALLEEMSVMENVRLPLYFSKGPAGVKKRRAAETLRALGIEGLAKKRVNQLSGGQKQRVAIARALVTRPRYLLADEPTGSLDTKTSQEIMKIFLELNRQGITVIIVTHNMEIAGQCRRVMEIRDGRLASGETALL